MKNLTALITMSLLACALTGCAEADPSILFNAHVFATSETADCLESEPVGFDDQHNVSASFFVNLSQSSEITDQVGLVMTNRLDSTDSVNFGPDDRQLRSDLNAITVEAIEFTMADGGPLSGLGDGGVIRVNSGTLLRTDGDIHFFAPLVSLENRPAWEALAPTNGAIVSTFMDIQVFGTTVAGDPVESNVMTMPLQLCADCEVDSTLICRQGS